MDRCQILYYAEKFDSATECTTDIVADRENTTANELLYQIYSSAGLHEKAVEKFVENLSNSKSEVHRSLADRFRQACAAGGIPMFRQKQIEFYRDVDVSHYKLARVFAETGDVPSAIAALGDAIKTRDFDVVYYAPDPAFHAIRTGARRSSIEGLPLK